MAPIGYRVLQESGVAFLAATDAVGLLGTLQEELGTWGKSAEQRAGVSGASRALRGSRSQLSAGLPSCPHTLPAPCLFAVLPTVCQSRFLTSHLKLDPNFETRSTPAPLGSSGSSSAILPARKGCRDGSQG